MNKANDMVVVVVVGTATDVVCKQEHSDVHFVLLLGL